MLAGIQNSGETKGRISAIGFLSHLVTALSGAGLCFFNAFWLGFIPLDLISHVRGLTEANTMKFQQFV